MRLFIAINFNDEVKDRIYSTAVRLKEMSRFGNFSKKENLHLTLTFIGETKRSGDVIDVLDKISFKPFEIEISKLGRFLRGGKDIYWLGVRAPAVLGEIANKLSKDLVALGFDIDGRSFRPHLTIGREVVMDDGFDMQEFSSGVKPISFTVRSISLMKSERIAGKLTYTQLYAVNSKIAQTDLA